MNFLCHAMPYFESPMMAACTAVPDWLSVVDRRIRARGKLAAIHLDSSDESLRNVAQGVIQHIEDDRWFHGTAAFVETNMELAVQLRDLLPGDRGFRPTFVGHILIEMFLDSFWLREDQSIGEHYYDMLAELDRDEIQRCVNSITGKPTSKLSATIDRFIQSRFLFDYLEYEGLLMRLNQVMKRIKLEQLPQSLLAWLPSASKLVESRRERFLTPPDGSTPFGSPFGNISIPS